MFLSLLYYPYLINLVVVWSFTVKPELEIGQRVFILGGTRRMYIKKITQGQIDTWYELSSTPDGPTEYWCTEDEIKTDLLEDAPNV